MSRFSTLAASSAAKTSAIAFEFASSAPAAVGAWVSTPAVIVARSGTASTCDDPMTVICRGISCAATGAREREAGGENGAG